MGTGRNPAQQSVWQCGWKVTPSEKRNAALEGRYFFREKQSRNAFKWAHFSAEGEQPIAQPVIVYYHESLLPSTQNHPHMVVGVVSER